MASPSINIFRTSIEHQGVEGLERQLSALRSLCEDYPALMQFNYAKISSALGVVKARLRFKKARAKRLGFGKPLRMDRIDALKYIASHEFRPMETFDFQGYSGVTDSKALIHYSDDFVVIIDGPNIMFERVNEDCTCCDDFAVFSILPDRDNDSD